ncbi:MAG: EamA family transporter [Chloroflexi bacterium]|nr:EamA family transporter [Chloroflexota bacterium]
MLCAVARRQHQFVIPSWRDVLLFIALGATGLAGFNVFVVLAVADADPSAVGVIIEGAPIVLALAGPLLSRAAPSTRLVLAACVVTTGAALVEGVAGSTT